MAFANKQQVLIELQEALKGTDLDTIEVSHNEVSLDDAVGPYLFNSQLLIHPKTKKESL